MRKAATDLMANVNKLYLKPDQVYFCFDSSSWRKYTDANYKSDRSSKEQGFYDVINDLYDLMVQNGFNAVKGTFAESDDCIAVLCEVFPETDKIIISADEDMHQLINENTVVWNNNLKKPIVFLSSEQNQKVYLNVNYEKKVVDPKLSLFKKVMLGCSGDNISPLIEKRGVGEKTIEKLYHPKMEIDIENILDLEEEVRKKLKYERPDFINKAETNLQLVTLGSKNLPDNILNSIIFRINEIIDRGENLENEYVIDSVLKNSKYFQKF
jgi:DNA polymerase-1